MIAPNIVLDHFKDGKKTGHDEFMGYVTRTDPPRGSFEPIETWAINGLSITGRGSVKKFGLTFGINFRFVFDTSMRIAMIKIWR